VDYAQYIPLDFDLCIFDLDGTLVDTLEDLYRSVNWALSSEGFDPVDRETVRRGVGNGARNLMIRCFTASGGAAAVPTGDRFDGILARYRDRYEQTCADSARLYPGTEKWIDDLRARGCLLAVLTNKPAAAAEKLLTALGVASRFDEIAGPETHGALKPNPSGLHAIIRRFDADPARTVMIGDSSVDVETGRNAGVLTCGLTGGLGDEDALRASLPDILIERSLA